MTSGLPAGRGCCAVCVAVGLCLVVAPVLLAAEQAAERVFSFNIPARNLRDALLLLAISSDHRLLYRPSLVEGKYGSPVRGAFTTTRALDTLLAHTDLGFEITDEKVVIIRRPVAEKETVRRLGVNASREPAETGRLMVLEEIVVTAQKRPELLQSIPVAAQALNDRELQQAGVKDFSNINKVAPNLQVFQGAGAPIIAIRGIRANAFGAASESPTAVHLDGNYVSEVVGLTGMFFDLDRVEIMPGPQGTLFGRNAAAGAVNIVTRKPVLDVTELSLEAELGSYSLERAEASLNLPVSSNLALRIAGHQLQRDGYYENGLDDSKQWAMRLSALSLTGDHSSLTMQFDYARNEPKGTSDNLIEAGVPGNGLSAPPSRDNTALYGNAARSQQNQKFWGVNFLYEREVGAGSLSLQGSHRDVSQSDYLYGAQNLSHPTEFGESHSFEARLMSPAGGPLEWVSGLYYFHEKKAGGVGIFGDLESDTLESQIEILKQQTDSAAAFGQLSYQLGESLRATLGGRFNHDRKTSSSVERAPFGILYFQPEESGDWAKMTWKAGLSYSLGDNTLLFANISTGYKSGSFAYGPAPRIIPQDVLAYELGAKSRLLDETLQLNLNVFYSDYQSMEQAYTTPIPGTPFFLIAVTNTGGAVVFGADAVAEWLPTDKDRFRAQLNYLHASYREFDLTPFGAFDYSHLPLANAPLWAGSAAYTHAWPLAQGRIETALKLQFGSARGISGIGGYSVAGIPFMQPDYAIGDLNISFFPAAARWNLMGYVNNLTDTTVLSSANYSPGRGYNVYAQLAPPRTYGLIFSVKM